MTKTSRSNVLERRISGEQVAPPALAKNEAGPGRPPGLGCRWAPATNTHDGRADRTLGRVTRDRELTGGGGGGGGEGVGLCHAARLRKTSSKDNRRCASAPRLCQAEAAVAVAASLLDWPGRRQKRRRGSSSGRSSRSRRKMMAKRKQGRKGKIGAAGTATFRRGRIRHFPMQVRPSLAAAELEVEAASDDQSPGN
ncbi:unnamed protein product [Prorocentrum cordatum]|uniref:Uncharacterized protein n=1 Tax=Prorocentrum cordatum TaxID=2364126 RepID=A0ABN9YGX1_9DINO|nr:unnamed protein product [Polarella glacialis]